MPKWASSPGRHTSRSTSLSPCVTTLFKRSGVRWSLLGANGDQFEQHLVALGGQLVDRLAVRLLEDAVDDLLLKLRGELGIAQPWPPGGHAWHQGVHEVLDTALTAAQMPQQVGTHHTPAQTGTPRQRVVGVGDVEHALADQVEHLPIQR